MRNVLPNGLFWFSISLGNIHTGYYVNEINCIWNYFPCIYPQIEVEKRDHFIYGVLLITPIIASFTSFMTGYYIKYSCRRLLILGNAIALLSWCILCIKHYAALYVGRVLRGIVTGIMSVTVPYFINEVTSTKFKLQWLGFIEQGIVMGYFFACLVRLVVPPIRIPENNEHEYCYSIEGQNLNWRYVFLFPIIPSIIQLVLLCFLFKTDAKSNFRK